MKKIKYILLFSHNFTFAENNLSKSINSVFDPIVEIMSKIIFWEPFSMGIPIVVIWLISGAVFFTLKMKFVNIFLF
jgi:AGCS family alanine or glycine:cation symporter